MALTVEPNLSDPDEMYDRLVALQARHGPDDWPLASARLLLILINHVGDRETLLEAFERVDVQHSR